MTASREKIIDVCESMDRFFEAGKLGNGVIAVERKGYHESHTLGFEGLRDRGWYLSNRIYKDGGSIEILMPWGNPHSEGGDEQ